MILLKIYVSLCKHVINTLIHFFSYLWNECIVNCVCEKFFINIIFRKYIVDFFCNKDNIESIIAAIIATLLFTIIWELKTAPKLIISKDDSWGIKHEHHSKAFMYYHLNVSNKKARCITRKPAISCRIEVEVFKIFDNDVCKIQLNKNENAKFYARWTSHPEPIRLQYVTNAFIHFADITKVYTEFRHDVYVHEEELVPIAIKYRDEKYCYMFNNESFLHSYKKGDYKEPLFHLDADEFYLILNAYYRKKRPSIHFFKLKNSGTCYRQLELKKLCSYTNLKLARFCPNKCKYIKEVKKCLESKKCSEIKRPKQTEIDFEK